jgi:hypothetical protein
MSMKRFIFCAFTIILAASALQMPVAAVTGGEWQSGRVIDDSVFNDPNTMNTTQIQAFLNAKVPSCDTNGTQTSEYGGGTRAQYGTAHGHPPPYVCLRDYYENPQTHANNLQGNPMPAGGISAAQIIATAAVTYGINPEVLIATLQKESPGPLVTDTWPFWSQYDHAMGSGCPDSAPCDPQFAGFYNQMMNAASRFRYYANNPTQYRYKAYQNNDILYNPNTSCGSSSVNIQTQATANLYIYTPYQPNQAALNNLYGSGDGCSAYGNRNFWRIFNDWFGSTIGPPYQWAIESFTYSGGDNSVGTDQTETLTLKARNTGRLPWYNHGDGPVRLATWGPDRQSELYNGTWPSTTRAANLQESVVQPSEVGTFVFHVAPPHQGTFVEPLNLVVENQQWMPWPGFSPTIVGTGPYSWQPVDVIYEKGTGLMEPNSTQLITIRAKNTGSTTWDKNGPAPVRVGTWQPQRPSAVRTSDWMSDVRVVNMNENTVAPGQIAGFQFRVHMPSSGNYYERLNLVAEGQTWLNDPGLTLYLHGASYGWQPVWTSLSTGNVNIPRNTNLTVTMRVRNTGEMAWKKTDIYPIHLATAGPLNRGSAFYTPSWLNDIRMAGLVEDVVQPGQEGTFTFTAHTPSSPGPWYERISLVAEGLQWFNDPGHYYYINVK